MFKRNDNDESNVQARLRKEQRDLVGGNVVIRTTSVEPITAKTITPIEKVKSVSNEQPTKPKPQKETPAAKETVGSKAKSKATSKAKQSKLKKFGRR